MTQALLILVGRRPESPVERRPGLSVGGGDSLEMSQSRITQSLCRLTVRRAGPADMSIHPLVHLILKLGRK